jgi:hypothetical protein
MPDDTKDWPPVAVSRHGVNMDIADSALRIMALGVVILGLSGVGHVRAAEEQQSVDAFAAWQGRGQVYQTGPEAATFVGAFSGRLYLESGQGPLDAGYLTCPGMVEISLRDGSQDAQGRCTITAEDGARVFAEWRCSGRHLTGCDGEFTLTGGSGRLEGIKGGGPMVVRSGLSEIVVGLPGNMVQEAAGGVVIWRGLRYSLTE